MPTKIIRKFGPRAARCWRTQCPATAAKPCWLRGRHRLGAGLDIDGYFLSEIGLGEAARLYYRAAAAQEIGVSAVNRPLAGRQNQRELADVVADGPRRGAVLSINGLTAFRDVGRGLCRQRVNIALPYWELDTISGRRARQLGRFDEVWAPSRFIAQTLTRGLGRPVVYVPQPVRIPDEAPAPLDGGPLRILFFFDFDSHGARKNPEAAVRAFQAAFPGREDVALTIKARGGAADDARRAWLHRQAEADRRIAIIDATLSAEEISTLIAGHDVFLSLHRSEGFGLGCAEALSMGRIVVSTDYGGTTDFISEESGFPVAWRSVPVGAGEYVEPEGAHWADPSVEHAAERLRQVYDAPSEARLRAMRGREMLRHSHGMEAAGRRLREALARHGVV